LEEDWSRWTNTRKLGSATRVFFGSDALEAQLIVGVLTVPFPRLGNHPNIEKIGIVGDITEDRRIIEIDRTHTIAREHRGEVEPESVNMHLSDPITETVYDQLANSTMGAVERIACTRKIRV
jgi:hypothetical protein